MISVLIPLYNKSKSIVATISSVLSQTYKDFEILVVDDGSTDGSGEIIQSIKDDRIRYFRKKNGGVSSARNYGIEKAQYDWIALLDGDDLWKPIFLEEMVEMIQRYPKAALYGSGYAFQHIDNGDYDIPDLTLPPNFVGYIESYWSIAKDNILFTSSSVVINKNVFKAIGKYDEQLVRGEDVDLWFRIALHYPVAFLNKPLAIYRLQAENRSNAVVIESDKCLIWNLERFKKYELSNSKFKIAVDNWRMAHISNFLRGDSCEVTKIKPILNKMDLSSFSYIWTIFKYMPECSIKYLYKWYIVLKRFIKI